MIIESQEGMTIAVMGVNSALEIGSYLEVHELRFISTDFSVSLGKFYKYDAAVRALAQIKAAFLRGDNYYKVEEAAAE